ncbi:putative telomere length regulation protein elg1 [Erysiphe neolycopersici]|uniref:Putative telomere length regulation protein elg1 n=1 Tax=Erysiphe neolycopersici TaxID=212602 RepID=A0A420HQW4_9PEZI|nr:putative telomere length regulation protein elg1 [Erysiphe neolycopersici]
MSLQIESSMSSSPNESNLYSLFRKSSLRHLAHSSPVSDSQLNRSLFIPEQKNENLSRGENKCDEQVFFKQKEDWPITDDHHNNLDIEPIKSYREKFINEQKNRNLITNHLYSLYMNTTSSKQNSSPQSKSKIKSLRSSPGNESSKKIILADKLSTQPFGTSVHPSICLSESSRQSNDQGKSIQLTTLLSYKKSSRETMAISADINPRPRKVLRVSSSPSIGFVKLHMKNPMGFESKIIKIKYNIETGPKITQIFNTPKSCNLKLLQSSSNSIQSSVAYISESNERAIHPLFLGSINKKSKDLTDAPKITDNLSLRKQAKVNLVSNPESRNKPNSNSQNSKTSSNITSIPKSFSTTSYGERVKIFPKEAISVWPWKGVVHIRGINETDNLIRLDSSIKQNIQSHPKKLKEKAIEIDFSEDILVSIAENLSIKSLVTEIQESKNEDFPPIPFCLRLPVKHHESGISARSRVQKQIHSRIQTTNYKTLSSSEDEIQGSDSHSHIEVHPALSKAYQSVATSLSAFDCGKCESYSWAEKYAPKNSDEVLQIGPEAIILKEWLSNLIIGSAAARSSSSKRSQNLKMDSLSKRKRKSLKLEGFIVPSDEEESFDLDEINLPEKITRHEDDNQIKRTVVRGGELSNANKFNPKMYHTVLISGPNGSGKTAAVYAVANELNFEVFEINSSTRRNGKDILEKIGDMTLNHHVQKPIGGSRSENTGDKGRIETIPVDDKKTGIPGAIHSFFKSNSKTAKPQNPSSTHKLSTVSSEYKLLSCKDSNKAKLAQNVLSKDQKQSLILIEEADIIFKEDSQFWSTIENIIAVSKRPIIVTCNDETAIPLSHSSLYAILRFQPPPVDIAADYLLLIAACEGHIIQREAVIALYEERQMDIRASLSELNFWCQFGVGDVNRGLSWHLSRKQAGFGNNNPGNQIRVISEDAYTKGMGWIPQDIFESKFSCLDTEEILLHETSKNWNLDISDWGMSQCLSKWAKKVRGLNQDKDKQLAALNMFAEFTESISDSDLISNSLFGSENQLILDTYSPDITDKLLKEYPLAYKTIEATPTFSYTHTGQNISLYLRSRARNLLQVTQKLRLSPEIDFELSSPSENRVIDLIRKKRTVSFGTLPRSKFSQAFDPISNRDAQQSTSAWGNGIYFEASQFNGTQRIICEDLAPYVRGILANYARLQREREKLSNSISESGLGGKRRRTTRTAMSALEGGIRSETRPERYFGNKLNPYLVEKTGVSYWNEALIRRQKWQKANSE